MIIGVGICLVVLTIYLGFNIQEYEESNQELDIAQNKYYTVHADNQYLKGYHDCVTYNNTRLIQLMKKYDDWNTSS